MNSQRRSLLAAEAFDGLKMNILELSDKSNDGIKSSQWGRESETSSHWDSQKVTQTSQINRILVYITLHSTHWVCAASFDSAQSSSGATSVHFSFSPERCDDNQLVILSHSQWCRWHKVIDNWWLSQPSTQFWAQWLSKGWCSANSEREMVRKRTHAHLYVGRWRLVTTVVAVNVGKNAWKPAQSSEKWVWPTWLVADQGRIAHWGKVQYFE